jgi:hypothetical protein
MNLTFGATTYTSVAKAIQSALAEPPATGEKLSRALKGHLKDDKRIFTATLDKDAQGKDVVVITGDTQLSPAKAMATLTSSIGFRQVLPVTDAAGRIKSNLVGLLREAFQKAKAGKLPELDQFDGYLAQKTAHTIETQLGKSVESRLGNLQGIKSLKELETLTSVIGDKQEKLLGELEAFRAIENTRLLRANSKGQINAAQLAQYQEKLNALVNAASETVSGSVQTFLNAQRGQGSLSERIKDCQDKLKTLHAKLKKVS